MKRLALSVAAFLIGMIAVAGVVGTILPRDHVASIQVRIDKPAVLVFQTISDVAEATEWRSDLRQVEILAAGADTLRWRETTGSGTLEFAVEESRPPTRYVTRIDDPQQQFGGRWIYQLTEASDTTTLTITEHGEVYNPFFRFMARFVFGHYRTMEKYAGDLAHHLGSTVAPVRVSTGI
jgi:uncharacterized protein YndB with AHSA1/START domain